MTFIAYGSARPSAGWGMFVLDCSIKWWVSYVAKGWPPDHGPTNFGAMVKNPLPITSSISCLGRCKLENQYMYFAPNQRTQFAPCLTSSTMSSFALSPVTKSPLIHPSCVWGGASKRTNLFIWFLISVESLPFIWQVLPCLVLPLDLLQRVL